MKFSTATLLPLAAISTAFIIPGEELTAQIVGQSWLDSLSEATHDVLSQADETVESAQKSGGNALDDAMQAMSAAGENAYNNMMEFDIQGWLDSAVDGHHGHHVPPHHGHGQPNLTVYQLIRASKYTTYFANLIDHFPDVVELLNGTTANFTVFAPTNKAFETYPNAPKHRPADHVVKPILDYHLSKEFYPAGRLLATHTLPSTYLEPALGGEAQRLRIGLGLKGISVNLISRVIAVNIFGTNGVIHGIDYLLVPPPKFVQVLEAIPAEFSTLKLALDKTNLFHEGVPHRHIGGTFFAPSNWAFQKLGMKANAFLFGKHGTKYLKALLQYHIAGNQTLYTDAFYKAKSEEVEAVDEINTEGIPKGHFHIDLPTLLPDRSLSIDIARFGGLMSFKINGFSAISKRDGIVEDGVIHLLHSVLIPPKTLGAEMWAGGEVEVEDLIERLSPFVDEHDEEL